MIAQARKHPKTLLKMECRSKWEGTGSLAGMMVDVDMDATVSTDVDEEGRRTMKLPKLTRKNVTSVRETRQRMSKP